MVGKGNLHVPAFFAVPHGTVAAVHASMPRHVQWLLPRNTRNPLSAERALVGGSLIGGIKETQEMLGEQGGDCAPRAACRAWVRREGGCI